MERRTADAAAAKIANPFVDEAKSKAGRFITLSMFVHAAMVATVALMSFPKSEINKPEVIEIEMADEVPATAMASPAAEALVSSEDISPEPPSAPAAQAQAAPAPAITSLPAAAKTPSVPKAAPATAEVEAAAPVKAEPAQSLPLETTEEGDVAIAPTSSTVVEDESEKIEQDREQALVAEATAREEQAEKQAAALAEQKNREDAKLAEAAAIENETRRAREAQEAQEAAEAEAAAQAKAQADKQARLQAAREARAKERADAEARARNGNGTSASESAGTTAGTGTGDSTSPEATKHVEGIPGGVRTLGQLRQQPGNKSPQYDAKERLARQEGDVVYYAYVNTDGTLSQFKIAQSTGFKNLDEKTLTALKKWKFYPGQEGWVEMPFKWSLRGEAQQAGGLLR